MALVVKRAAAKVGLTAELFSGHSLRAGFVTEAKKNGADDAAIMDQTGHKSLAWCSATTEGRRDGSALLRPSWACEPCARAVTSTTWCRVERMSSARCTRVCSALEPRGESAIVLSSAQLEAVPESAVAKGVSS